MKGREIEPGWLPGTVQYGKWEENIKTSRESHELVCTGVADVMKILGLCHRQVVLSEVVLWNRLSAFVSL